MPGWASLKTLIQMEIKQRAEEGCIVEGFFEKWEEAGDSSERLMEIYVELMKLPVDESFPYEEPSDLEQIRAQRIPGPRTIKIERNEEQWIDRFHGAWLGRSVGCALGKPLEISCFMDGSDGRPGWKNIYLWFEGADAWPIQGYTPEQSRAKVQYGLDLCPWGTQSTLEKLEYMESDDDIRYTVLGLILLEEKGANWDSWDVGKLWHQRLTLQQVCTAETQAYMNFSQMTSRMEGVRPDDWEAKKDWVRTYLNPYREWIGAQIRADALAYGAAANPELAAEFAWRDASFSHVKNGIYGEMFVAAMISAAFAETDPLRIVEIGLSEIPKNSRLYHDVRKALDISLKARDQLELVHQLWETFKHYDSVHTNNNAALVAAALVFSKGDFAAAVTTAVLGGWDTDCNGATIGSILGAMLGAKRLPSSWVSPLNDTMYAEIIGFHPISISECAERSYQVFRKISTNIPPK